MLEHFKRYLTSDNDGVVAIEFALVVMPFIILLVGIVEIGLFYASGALLEGASVDAARLIRTGQVQDASDPETAFKQELCSQAAALIPCTDIQYEVIDLPSGSFIDAEDYQPVVDSDGNLVPQGFDAGNSNDVVMVRTYYKYHFMTPFIGEMISGKIGQDWMGQMSTVVIKSEPYNFGEM
ncbi:MAG: pilus assembly protein [Alphaproteobacteria bacterium]|nr:pilus assembly protein [Alphaproteobacteria bacterium]